MNDAHIGPDIATFQCRNVLRWEDIFANFVAKIKLAEGQSEASDCVLTFGTGADVRTDVVGTWRAVSAYGLLAVLILLLERKLAVERSELVVCLYDASSPPIGPSGVTTRDEHPEPIASRVCEVVSMIVAAGLEAEAELLAPLFVLLSGGAHAMRSDHRPRSSDPETRSS
ncbi:hypothetical protein BDR05DRAFT_945817 [Suillus weaverae]|nr:hypothetical protein BDR05DRAFT_945817 [Suillus weaverae]